MRFEFASSAAGQTPVHPDDLEGLRMRWIRTQGQLDEVERDNVLDGRRWLLRRRRPLEQLLDDLFVRELHRRSFGDVWSWAGSYRRRQTSIGVGWERVPVALRDALHDAAAWLETAADESLKRDAVARLHHAVVAVHPFVNGNGRTARLHADALAVSLDLPEPAWARGEADPRETYLASLRVADLGDLHPLIDVMWPPVGSPA